MYDKRRVRIGRECEVAWEVTGKPELEDRSGRAFFPRLLVATWTQRSPDSPWIKPRMVLVRGVLKGAKGQPLKTETRATCDVGGIGHGRWPTWVHGLIDDFDPDKEVDQCPSDTS